MLLQNIGLKYREGVFLWSSFSLLGCPSAFNEIVNEKLLSDFDR